MTECDGPAPAEGASDPPPLSEKDTHRTGPGASAGHLDRAVRCAMSFSRQGSPAIAGLRSSGARDKPSEPDADHTDAGSLDSHSVLARRVFHTAILILTKDGT